MPFVSDNRLQSVWFPSNDLKQTNNSNKSKFSAYYKGDKAKIPYFSTYVDEPENSPEWLKSGWLLNNQVKNTRNPTIRRNNLKNLNEILRVKIYHIMWLLYQLDNTEYHVLMTKVLVNITNKLNNSKGADSNLGSNLLKILNEMHEL